MYRALWSWIICVLVTVLVSLASLHKPGMVSIWFLIGLLLTAYGVLIAAAGVYQELVPPPQLPVLANLHAGIWWGLADPGNRPFLLLALPAVEDEIVFPHPGACQPPNLSSSLRATASATSSRQGWAAI